MPRQMLTGTLDEQCAFLFNLAKEKMAASNFTGAIHALKEIGKYAPDYPGMAELLEQARKAKREQALLVWFGFIGAMIGVFVGRWRGVPNDLWFLGLALAGAVIGYLLGIGIVRMLKGRGVLPETQLPPDVQQSADPGATTRD